MQVSDCLSRADSLVLMARDDGVTVCYSLEALLVSCC